MWSSALRGSARSSLISAILLYALFARCECGNSVFRPAARIRLRFGLAKSNGPRPPTGRTHFYLFGVSDTTCTAPLRGTKRPMVGHAALLVATMPLTAISVPQQAKTYCLEDSTP